jgi:hypothetical protein
MNDIAREQIPAAARTLQSALARAQADLDLARAEARSRRQNEDMLKGRLARQDALIASFKAQLEDIPLLRSRIKEIERLQLAAEEKLADTRRELADRCSELADVTRALLAEEEQGQEHQQTADKLLRMLRVLMRDNPWWWDLMPKGWRRKRISRRLAREELFDAAAYAKQFPDVIAAGQEPLRHYIFHGIDELRSGNR